MKEKSSLGQLLHSDCRTLFTYNSERSGRIKHYYSGLVRRKPEIYTSLLHISLVKILNLVSHNDDMSCVSVHHYFPQQPLLSEGARGQLTYQSICQCIALQKILA